MSKHVEAQAIHARQLSEARRHLSRLEDLRDRAWQETLSAQYSLRRPHQQWLALCHAIECVRRVAGSNLEPEC